MRMSSKIRRAGLGNRLLALGLAATALTASVVAAEAGEWQLHSVNGKPAAGKATWTFNADGTFGGSTGCNRFTAAGQFASGWLVADGPVATTQMACADAAITAQEAHILSLFEAGLAITYDPFAETLKLTGRTATVVLVPLADEPAPTGPAAVPDSTDPEDPAVESAPETESEAPPESLPAETPTLFNTAYVVVHGLSGRLNVRGEASTSARIVGGVRAGALLSNKGCEDRADRTWCHVAHIGNGRPQGWVAAEYLQPAPAALRAAGSLFDGIGTLTCTATGAAPATCDYGVAHDPDGTAAVTVFLPDGSETLVVFRDGALVRVGEAGEGEALQPTAENVDGRILVATAGATFEFPANVITPG